MDRKTSEYKIVRDLAWDVLLRNKVSSLPVDVFAIAKQEGINVFSYSKSMTFIKELLLESEIIDNDAFSVGNMVFYDDNKSIERQRFSIAHEIGHILLHIPDNKRIFYRQDSEAPDAKESEANMFASRLLAPLCVLQFLNLNSAKEIAEVCNISYTSAKIRFNRLCEIRKRSALRRRSAKNHGTFLVSKKERELVANFAKFIEENKVVNHLSEQLQS